MRKRFYGEYVHSHSVEDREILSHLKHISSNQILVFAKEHKLRKLFRQITSLAISLVKMISQKFWQTLWKLRKHSYGILLPQFFRQFSVKSTFYESTLL